MSVSNGKDETLLSEAIAIFLAIIVFVMAFVVVILVLLIFSSI